MIVFCKYDTGPASNNKSVYDSWFSNFNDSLVFISRPDRIQISLLTHALVFVRFAKLLLLPSPCLLLLQSLSTTSMRESLLINRRRMKSITYRHKSHLTYYMRHIRVLESFEHVPKTYISEIMPYKTYVAIKKL